MLITGGEHHGSRPWRGSPEQGAPVGPIAPAAGGDAGGAPEPDALAAQVDRVRLESDTLYDVIRVIASPDVGRVLTGVVDVLTRATRCNACFVYLRSGDRLRLAAASPLYDHHVDRVEFGDQQGLAGWVLRRNAPAFIRDRAMDDPRTHYVPELEEERFQSVVAVPIPGRRGAGIGAIVMNAVAPWAFDEGTLNVLSHTASLVAGAIENAQLYDEARRRVEVLTALTGLGQRIAAVTGREELCEVATSGVRSLLGCTEVRLYQLDQEHQRMELMSVASATPSPHGAGMTLLPIDLLQHVRDGAPAPEILGLPAGTTRVMVAPVVAGDESLGVLLAAGDGVPDDSEELLRVAANHIAVGLQRAELIENLTEENVVGNLFRALEAGRADEAEARARQARCDLDRAGVLVEVRAAQSRGKPVAWPLLAERVDAQLRRVVPGAIFDHGPDRLRARLPLAAGDVANALLVLDRGLAALGADHGVVVGRSEPHRGAAAGRDALREAADSVVVGQALLTAGGVMSYAAMGAYRYLVHVSALDDFSDPYLAQVRVLRDYDERRGTQLLNTLEEYLAERGSVKETARKLIVHPNTLRQRLERIETLTTLELASVDVLALALAVKFARLTAQR